MERTTICKDVMEYSSFPLLSKRRVDDIDVITIGFFAAPYPDHYGINRWITMEAVDRPVLEWFDTIGIQKPLKPYESSRDISDRFIIKRDNKTIIIGAPGFAGRKGETKINAFTYIYRRVIDHKKRKMREKKFIFSNAKNVVCFPRSTEVGQYRKILIPAYIVLHNGINRSLIIHNQGESIDIFPMFSFEVNSNEVALVKIERGYLAHIRCDHIPFLLESRSLDGRQWTYPTAVQAQRTYKNVVVGGPSHLLRLKNGLLVCSFANRQTPMGIYACISVDDGTTWKAPIELRTDCDFRSSLHKKKRVWSKLPPMGMDMGYPVSIQLNDESILTAYYITSSDGVTHIETTRWMK